MSTLPKQIIEESYKLRLTTMESNASLHLDPPLPQVIYFPVGPTDNNSLPNNRYQIHTPTPNLSFPPPLSHDHFPPHVLSIR